MTNEERNKVIRILKWLHDNNFLFRSTEEDVKYATKLAIQELEQETRWIPVSDGLPKKEMDCLVTDNLGKVHKVTFYNALDGRKSYFSGCYCVMAWMPSPKPYVQLESEG